VRAAEQAAHLALPVAEGWDDRVYCNGEHYECPAQAAESVWSAGLDLSEVECWPSVGVKAESPDVQGWLQARWYGSIDDGDGELSPEVAELAAKFEVELAEFAPVFYWAELDRRVDLSGEFERLNDDAELQYEGGQ
jgi:hypothetical protein